MNNKEIFYDTDCLSCFISINDVTILKQLFERVIIPYEVYEEFSRVIILKMRVDELHYEGFLEIKDFDVESESYNLFLKLQVLSVIVCISSFKLPLAFRMEQIIDFFQILSVPYNLYLMQKNPPKNAKPGIYYIFLGLILAIFSD